MSQPIAKVVTLGGVRVMIRTAVAVGLAALVGACASTQTQENASQMVGSIGRLREQQVLANISAAIDDRDFVPSAFVLGTGQANSTVGVAPALKGTSLTAPKPMVEFDVSPTDTWTAQWQFTSVNDQGDLRRLRNIYALIVATNQQYNELENYFHPRCDANETTSPTLPGAGAGGGVAEELADVERLDDQGIRTPERCRDPRLPPPSPTEAATPPAGQNPPADAHTQENASVKLPDQVATPWEVAKSLIFKGDSIDCRLYQAGRKKDRLFDQDLPYRRWLFWRRPGEREWSPAPHELVTIESIGRHGRWELGIATPEDDPEAGRACLDDFVILVQSLTPVANQTSAGPKYFLQ